MTTTIMTMEIDANISDILREVITFLEYLRDAQLPLALESLREKLLKRSKNTLRAIPNTMIRSSPEPYLDMNSGPKTILLTKTEADTEEYVGMEESSPGPNHQDYYYETFEHESQPQVVSERAKTQRAEDENEEEDGQALMNIYKNLTAAQTKSSCHKCGPLHRKEGKKLFMSDSRACWIALVGSHLLVYRSERHNRPQAIYPIRGYMARPAPNLLPRDRQKSESAFEIYCPGSETLQFIARTPKDMDQWIAKVCEVGCANETATKDEGPKDHGNKSNASSESTASRPEDSAATTTARRQKAKDTVESPPALPARIPRRLPSVPSDDSVPVYRAVEDYDDDDDIYHKIEDLQNETAYQNVKLAKRQCAKVGDEEHESMAAGRDEAHASKERTRAQEEKSDVTVAEEEMYDDIFVLSRTNAFTSEEKKPRNGDGPVAVDDGEESFYDDVERVWSRRESPGKTDKRLRDKVSSSPTPSSSATKELISKGGSRNLLGRSVRDNAREQTETSSKFLQKKSFLERVWSRRESPGKTDKRLRDKVSSSPTRSSSATKAMPTYDDVSNLTTRQESPVNNGEEELPEYNCPPPPRPVYTKLPLNVNHTNSNTIVELYDDVNTCREQYNNNHQQTALQSTQESCVARATKAKNDATRLNANEELPPEEEVEHYQSPRSDLRVNDVPEYQNEQLYDDIALCANFKARQRNVNEKKDNEDGKSTVGSDKKSRNRFSMHKKSRSGESVCPIETNKRNANECEEIDDLAEINDAPKRNTFQRLISKMENSLASLSARNQASSPMSKPSTASNNS